MTGREVKNGDARFWHFASFFEYPLSVVNGNSEHCEIMSARHKLPAYADHDSKLKICTLIL